MIFYHFFTDFLMLWDRPHDLRDSNMCPCVHVANFQHFFEVIFSSYLFDLCLLRFCTLDQISYSFRLGPSCSIVLSCFLKISVKLLGRSPPYQKILIASYLGIFKGFSIFQTLLVILCNEYFFQFWSSQIFTQVFILHIINLFELNIYLKDFFVLK